MSLDIQDLIAIRSIIREEIEPVENKVEALENDIKEIYFILAKMQTVES